MWRRTLAIVGLLLVVAMSKQVICRTSATTLVNSAVRYGSPLGNLAMTSATDQWSLIGAAGNLRNWCVDIADAPGAGKSWTFAILINDVATLTVTIADAATSARHTGLDVAVAEGDRIDLRITPSGTPNGTSIVYRSLEFDSTTAGESLYGGKGTAINQATENCAVFTPENFPATNFTNVVSAPGALRRIVVRSATAHTGGQGYHFYAYKNGVKQDGTGGTVDTKVTHVGVASSSRTFTLPLDPGDTVYIEGESQGGLSTLRYHALATGFLADTPGQSQVAGITTINWGSTDAAQYHDLSQDEDGWNGTETARRYFAGPTPFTLSDFYLRGTPDPGSGKTRTLTVMKNGSAPGGGPAITVSNGQTGGSDLVGTVAIADGDTFSMRHTSSGVPTVGKAYWTLTQTTESDEEPEPGPGPGDESVGTAGIIEMCFHRGNSFRTWIRYHLTGARFWWLGDVQTLDATDDLHEAPQFGAFGTYEQIPTKVYGLVPEYGLATWFDGAVQRVTTLTGLVGTGGEFSLAALVRPDAAGLGSAQCVYQTGATGSAYLGLNASNQAVFGVNGGTLIASTLVLEADHIYLLIGAYDGSDGTLYAVECIADQELDVTGPTALTFTAPHDIGTIGSNENTEYFTGAIQHVAELTDALELVEAEGLYLTSFWTDVTPDVEGAVISDIGIHDDHPLARVAASGQLRLTMDNSHLNSAGLEGYYSPDHANRRNGFHKGIPIRFSLFDQGSPTERRVQFIGSIKSIRPTPGIYLERRTAVLATDWMDEAARSTLRGIAVKENVTADEVVGHIVNAMRNRPHAIEFDTGSDTYPHAFHNATDERTSGQAELLKVAQSELGLIYVKGDGTLVFQSRHTRSTVTDVEHTLTDFLTVDQDDASDQAKNLVKVTAHPSRVGDDPVQVLYSNDASASPADPAIRLDNGVNLELFLPFRDLDGQETVRVGAVDIVDPVASTDYLISTADPDLSGSPGSDVTGNSLITLEFTLGGNGVYLNASNQYGQPVWITFLQIRGRAVYDFEPVTAIAKNDNNIDEVGEQELSLDMPYQSQVGIAQGAADFLLNQLRERNTRLRSVTLWGDYNSTHRQALIYGDISTRLHASELMSAVDGEFFVNAKRIEWKPSGDQGLGDIDVTFHLAEASLQEFWTLDQSALDETTRLAYL